MCNNTLYAWHQLHIIRLCSTGLNDKWYISDFKKDASVILLRFKLELVSFLMQMYGFCVFLEYNKCMWVFIAAPKITSPNGHIYYCEAYFLWNVYNFIVIITKLYRFKSWKKSNKSKDNRNSQFRNTLWSSLQNRKIYPLNSTNFTNRICSSRHWPTRIT